MFSPAYYYAFETGGHVVQRHIFQICKTLLFTCQFVYFYKSDFICNYDPEWSSLMMHLIFGICVGKSLTSQCNQ